MSEPAGEKKVVCVTGASGYIASWLVKFLLQRGYSVRATVRDPNDPKKTEHLLALDGAKERLHLFKAELLEEGAFDSIVDGCEGVFHTASPVLLSAANPQEDLIDPAVKGTVNVLTSCAKASTIKRVVITSSIVSLLFNGKPLTSEVVVDETWFSDPGICEESKLWYPLSKTLAEEAAWKFAKDKEIDLVTIHPGLVIGPLLQKTLSLSIEIFLDLINGAQTFPMTIYRFIDVRDVVEAHIRALESPSSNGRYCLVGEVVHQREALKILRKLYPTNLQIHERCEDDDGEASVAPYEISKDKTVSLGIRFTPLEVSFKDTVESLKQQGFLKD